MTLEELKTRCENAGFKYAVYYREHEPKAIKL